MPIGTALISATVVIFTSCIMQNCARSGNRAIFPSSQRISQIKSGYSNMTGAYTLDQATT